MRKNKIAVQDTMIGPRVLIVNPPIYDFSAYDFWLRPAGALAVAGLLRGQAHLCLFDYLDRRHPSAVHKDTEKNPCGRGRFIQQQVEKPAAFENIPRYYKRFGLPRELFEIFLRQSAPFDFVLVQSVMTYWYPGVKEVIDDIRRLNPQAKIILGGFYATACRAHALTLGADGVIDGENLQPMWNILGLTPPEEYQPPAWELYPNLGTGVLKLTRGCPFQCSYCYMPVRGERFQVRPIEDVLADFEIMRRQGVRNIAFYDDALLYQPQETLLPFLEAIRGRGVNLHTPNGMHARMINTDMARALVQGGFKTFYLGFESASAEFQKQTGSKLVSQELASAVDALRSAGADSSSIIAYEMLGHPLADVQAIEESMRFANKLGIRIMFSEFSPIPGTPDGEICRNYVDLDEPLNHNKSAFPILFLGWQKIKYYKSLCRELNETNFGKST
jgi:radical SAM superfamily enzyme YgiQ (UPF0313 family)